MYTSVHGVSTPATLHGTFVVPARRATLTTASCWQCFVYVLCGECRARRRFERAFSRRPKFDFLALVRALSRLPKSGTLVGDVVGVEERAVSPMSSSRDQLIKAFETLDVDGSGACVANQLRTWATKSSPT